MHNYQLASVLNLPNDIIDDLEKSIDQNRIQSSWFRMDSTKGRAWIEKIILRWFFKQGWFQCYRVEPHIEERIYKHLHKFIDIVEKKPKIRIKITHNVRQLMPHSDAADGGDQSSVVVLIRGNQETTNWYNAGRECQGTWSEILSLTKIESVQFQPGASYLFNNEQVHSVSDCKPETTRYLLSISWQEVSYNKLVQTLKDYEQHNCN